MLYYSNTEISNFQLVAIITVFNAFYQPINPHPSSLDSSLLVLHSHLNWKEATLSFITSFVYGWLGYVRCFASCWMTFTYGALRLLVLEAR